MPYRSSWVRVASSALTKPRPTEFLCCHDLMAMKPGSGAVKDRPFDPLPPGCPLASFAVRRQEQSAASSAELGPSATYGTAGPSEEVAAHHDDGRRFSYGEQSFSPEDESRCVSLRPRRADHHGRSTSSRIGVRPSEGRGTAPVGRDRAWQLRLCRRVRGAAPAAPYDTDLEIPPARAQVGPGCARDPAARARGGTRTPRGFYPASGFHTTQCAGFPCNLGLFKWGAGAVPICGLGKTCPPPGWEGSSTFGSLPCPEVRLMASRLARVSSG